ncbi:MAG: hypothetical protein HY741_15150 [Chloroflexi bacterium]|nr:hypothetical protein [Chloroflexota bacterium]
MDTATDFEIRELTLLKILTHATLADVESSSFRPPVGRRIALQLSSARPLTWLGPIAATICGALAASGLIISGETLLRVAIAVLLTDPILGAWRAAWVNTDWRRPMQGWRATPTRAWMLVPYARLGSPAARFSQWLSSRANFWRDAIVPHVGQSITAIIVTALIALSIALALSYTAFVLTLVALAFAPLESELGEHGAGRWARALVEIGMAWLIGDAAISQLFPPLDSAILALLFAMTYRGLLSVATRPRLGLAIADGSQIAVIVFLIARGAMISATIIGLALGAQLLWQTLVRTGRLEAKTFLERVQWFVLLAMVIAALGS